MVSFLLLECALASAIASCAGTAASRTSVLCTIRRIWYTGLVVAVMPVSVDPCSTRQPPARRWRAEVDGHIGGARKMPVGLPKRGGELGHLGLAVVLPGGVQPQQGRAGGLQGGVRDG